MLKMVDGTGIIGVDMICPLGVSTPQPPNYDRVELEGTGMLVLPNSLDAPLERLELGGKTAGKKEVIQAGEFEQGTITAYDGTNYDSNYRVRTKNYINLTSGTYEVTCTGAKLGNVVFYSVENKFEKMLSGTHIPLPIKFTLTENKLVIVLFSNSESIPIAPTDIKNAILEADVSPEHPQEIVNVGKWNEETQKYEVDVKITNAEQNWSKEQTLTITSDRPITKWDRLVEQGGEIGWLYQSAIDTDVKPSRLDLFPYGFSLFKDFGNGVYVYKVVNIKKTTGFQTSLCEQFKNKDGSYSTGDLFCYSDQPSIKMQYFVTDISTLEEFKTWMETNPLTMVYKTESTEFIPLPQSEQNAIRALKTYYPTTVITVDGGEVDPDIKVTYRKEI